MRQAASNLAAASSALNAEIANVNLVFPGFDEQESRTILNVPFAIGPVPMVLQVDVFAGYGILGAFRLERDTTTELDQTVDSDRRVAHATVGVEPYASAGLSAFVGAGFDFGALSATVGLEGMVTLARINVPIVTGAGADLVSERDQRPLPGDVLPPVAQGLDAFLFGAPKSYRFLTSYDFGASVVSTRRSSGTLDGRVRVKFAFFRRTWRKRIAKPTRLPAETFELVSAESSRYPGVGGNTTATPVTAEGCAPTDGAAPSRAAAFPRVGSLPPVRRCRRTPARGRSTGGRSRSSSRRPAARSSTKSAPRPARDVLSGAECDNGFARPIAPRSANPGSTPGTPNAAAHPAARCIGKRSSEGSEHAAPFLEQGPARAPRHRLSSQARSGRDASARTERA